MENNLNRFPKSAVEGEAQVHDLFDEIMDLTLKYPLTVLYSGLTFFEGQVKSKESLLMLKERGE